MAVKKHRFSEHIKRSVMKALSFRIIVIATNALIVFGITKRYDLTLGVVLASNALNTVIYFFHERLWNQIHWGKHHA